jgi:parallel beta-helix repeat protein
MLVPQGSDNVTVEGLYLDGTNPNILPSPSIAARNTTFRRNDITNNHTAICVSLGHPDYGRAIDTTIELNRIHNCGVLPAANHDHGIYVTSATNTTIRGNWIYDNADRGIQLFPDAQKTTITNNVIDGNGQGIIFGGEGPIASNDNTVHNNVITNSKLRFNVESWYPAGTPAGTNNTVHHNCINGGPRDNGDGGISSGSGFSLASNLLRGPGFNNRAGKDFRLSPGSPCRATFPDADVWPGPDSGPGVARASASRGRAVTLRIWRGRTRVGRRVLMTGRVASRRARPGQRVIVAARTSGRWRRIGTARVGANGRFRLRPRMRARRGARVVRIRAIVRSVGRSRSVKLRLRRR